MKFKELVGNIGQKFDYDWSIGQDYCIDKLREYVKEYLPESRESDDRTVCGHVFRKGEGNYRCRNCGLDDTCVLCSKCFHATEHDGHDVIFSVTSGGGGVCDCGDPEAWKVELKCKIHSHDDKSQMIIDKEMGEDILEMMEFVLDVLERINSDRLNETPISITQKTSMKSVEELKGIFVGDEKLGVILWNDEYHSFDQVINIAQETLDCSEDEAKAFAESVDRDGLKVVWETCDLSEAYEICQGFRSIGLGCNIRRQGEIFDWMIAMESIEILSEIPNLGKLLLSKSKTGEIVIDRLFQYDLWLWKRPRQKVKQIIINAMMKRLETKLEIAKRFVLNYRKMAENFCEKDREHELNIILLSVQLFTTPSVSRFLISQTDILEIIIAFLLETISIVSSGRKYIHFYRDLEYLWSGNKSNDADETVKLYLQLLSKFTDMDLQKRQTQVHVEYENELWTHAFNQTYVLADNIQQFSYFMHNCSNETLNAIISALIATTKDEKIVSRDEVSFHQPLTWLLGSLIIQNKVNLISVDLEKVMRKAVETRVVIAQYKSGLWVRNGYAFINQIFNYTKVPLRCQTMDMDFAVIQKCFLSSFDLFDNLLNYLIMKFELTSTLLETTPSTNFDSNQTSLLIEELFLLIIHVLTDDTIITEKSLKDQLKVEIIHLLANGPCAYSQLEKQISHRLAGDLNECLPQLAVLKLPQSKRMDETGKYQLKQEYLQEINRFHIHSKDLKILQPSRIRIRSDLKQSVDQSKILSSLLQKIFELKISHQSLITFKTMEICVCLARELTLTESSPLIDLLRKFSQDEDLKELIPIINEIIPRNETPEITPEANTTINKEKASERRERIMREFQQRQKDFMNKNEINMDEDDSDDDVMDVDHQLLPTGRCMICQEQLHLNDDDDYGLVSCCQQSNLVRGGSAGVHLSTCGHLMHLKCHNDYKRNSRQEFTCPLCQSFCNLIIPVRGINVANVSSDNDDENVEFISALKTAFTTCKSVLKEQYGVESDDDADDQIYGSMSGEEQEDFQSLIADLVDEDELIMNPQLPQGCPEGLQMEILQIVDNYSTYASSPFNFPLCAVDRLNNIWRLLDYLIKSVHLSSSCSTNEGFLISVLSSFLSCPAEDPFRTCRILNSIFSNDPRLNVCLQTDSFSLFLAFVSDHNLRPLLNSQSAVDFFFLHSAIRYLLYSGINDQCDGNPFAREVVKEFFTQLKIEISSPVINNDILSKNLSLQTNSNSLEDHLLTFCDLLNILQRYAPFLVPSYWRSDHLLSIHHRVCTTVLPNSLQMVSHLLKNFAAYSSPFVSVLLQKKISHPKIYRVMSGLLNIVQLSSEAYQLTSLPYAYQELLEQSLAFVCKRCNTTPLNPALCLFCGQFLCASTYCCMVNGQGECFHHMSSCGVGVGMFLLVKKCSLLLIHQTHGCLVPAPYMDQHGETDVGLRRGKPQFLHKERFEELKRIWLKHELPSLIARKREYSSNDGGWELI